MTLSAAQVDNLKHARVYPRILPVILERWSPRSFSDRDVSSDDLKTVFEAARWAASSYNEQPWRFFLGRRGSETYRKIFQSLGEFNQAWAGTAPVLMLDIARTTFARNSSPNPVALYDLGAAAATLCYQAAALGLHAHQMAGFDRDLARKLFNVPEDFIFGAAIALGYQGDPSALSVDSQRDQEISPRTRKPIGEFVLFELGQPAPFD
ncbi:MAG TPA: nitroreductase family protein [Terracidiphilus sp.]|jgi:nitroreductase|nr:nitroreductase family protein [Terracidiphilus sp.]